MYDRNIVRLVQYKYFVNRGLFFFSPDAKNPKISVIVMYDDLTKDLCLKLT